MLRQDVRGAARSLGRARGHRLSVMVRADAPAGAYEVEHAADEAVPLRIPQRVQPHEPAFGDGAYVAMNFVHHLTNFRRLVCGWLAGWHLRLYGQLR